MCTFDSNRQCQDRFVICGFKESKRKSENKNKNV